ncbi:4'-phosphopantetheinyl transferase [Gemmatimonas sp.]|uniref:4'-phosphopantetheinyl transferase family protein n=1 Tax=Gemmatimonas sp. TaxID=1962908 RepID=UPI00356A5215
MTVSRLTLSAGLVPAGVALYGLRLPVNANAALEALTALGGESTLTQLPDRLAGAVAGRRASFLAGRWCAHQALRDGAPHAAQTPVGMGEFREPLWPAGTLGSIAHTTGFALAAAAPVGAVRAIGVDVERWLDDDAPTRLGPDLAGDGELDSLVAQTGWPAARLLTVLFSAKETIYKCLFPVVRAHFGFKAAWLERLDFSDGAEGRFVARLTGPLGSDLPAGLVLHGRFACLDEVVVTTLVLG